MVGKTSDFKMIDATGYTENLPNKNMSGSETSEQEAIDIDSI